MEQSLVEAEVEDVFDGEDDVLDNDDVCDEVFDADEDGKDEDFDEDEDLHEGEQDKVEDAVAVEISDGNVVNGLCGEDALVLDDVWDVCESFDEDLDLKKKKELELLVLDEVLEEAEAPTDLAFSRYRLYRSSMARISSSFLDN